MNSSWKTRAPGLVPPVLFQEAEVCWSIALVRQFEMTLKIEGKLALDKHLSIQELVNVLAVQFRAADGSIHESVHATALLQTIGTVLEEVCPLTWALDTHRQTPLQPGVLRYTLNLADDEVFGSDLFEDTLLQFLDKSPVAVGISVCPSYEITQHPGGIYDPSPEELWNSIDGHYVLLQTALLVGSVKIRKEKHGEIAVSF